MADISKIKLPNGSEYNLRDKLLLSRGEQLVVNGNALLGNNTNFSYLVFDGAHANNSPGSFTYLTSKVYINFTSDEFFPINPEKRYEVELDLITKNHLASMYTFLAFYDADKQAIAVNNHGYFTNSDLVLTSPCNVNSTQITVNDASYYSTLIGTKVSFIFWDYKNSFNYTYPIHTYSRYNSNEVTITGVSGNTITFSGKLGGSNVTHAAGTTLSRIKYGGTYKYVAANGQAPTNTGWTHYKGYMYGVDFSGQNVNGKFPPGVAYAKFGFLWNYNKADDQVWATNISVREHRDAYTVNNHTVNADVPSDAVFTDTTYTPASANPLMDGTVAVGTSVKYAREDHRHPTDTSRAPKSHASTATTYGIGTNNNYGHVKLSDTISGTAAAASGGTAATPKAVSDAKTSATNHVILSTTQPTNQAAGDYWFKLEEHITSDYQEAANTYGGNTAYISSTVQEG